MCGFYQFFLFAGVLVLICNNEIFSFYKFFFFLSKWDEIWFLTKSIVRLSLRNSRQPTPLFLPGESHGQRSLEGYSPRGLKESDKSEPLSRPLHRMIFKSKLTVIIKFSLNIKKKEAAAAVGCSAWLYETWNESVNKIFGIELNENIFIKTIYP